MALLGLVSLSACGGKVARIDECVNGQGACLSHDAPSPGSTSADGGIPVCPPGTNGQRCGADLDSGDGTGVGHDGGSAIDAELPSSLDPATACLGDDRIFVIAGDDNIHLGAPLTLRGGSGWSIEVSASSAGLPTHLLVHIQDDWVAEFSTEQLGVPLSPGKYVNAERAAFAEPNHPGLDVYGDGIGCNKVAGEFQILTIESSIDAATLEPVVTSLTATFEQHCEAGKRANVGCVRIRL